MTTMNPIPTKPQASTKVVEVCSQDDLVLNSGVCVLAEGKQIAIFTIIEASGELKAFACDNYDPFGKANVLSRGLICSVGAEVCICSPLYKQHFSLLDGRCLEDEAVCINVYKVDLVDNTVFLHMPAFDNEQAPTA